MVSPVVQRALNTACHYWLEMSPFGVLTRTHRSSWVGCRRLAGGADGRGKSVIKRGRDSGRARGNAGECAPSGKLAHFTLSDSRFSGMVWYHTSPTPKNGVEVRDTIIFVVCAGNPGITSLLQFDPYQHLENQADRHRRDISVIKRAAVGNKNICYNMKDRMMR